MPIYVDFSPNSVHICENIYEIALSSGKCKYIPTLNGVYIYIPISIIAYKECLITEMFNLLRKVDKCKKNIVSNGKCKRSSEKRKVSVN